MNLPQRPGLGFFYGSTRWLTPTS